MFVGIEATPDFDRRGQVVDDQARDPESGLRVWTGTFVDMAQIAGQPTGGFRQSAEVKVRIAAEHRPVPPASRVEGYGALVEFTGLTLTPYTDDKRCTGQGAREGKGHKCGARLAYSLRATGMVEFGTSSAR
jgi:hypothetical protein